MTDSKSRSGIVVLVGAGPGEASLMTLSGAAWLNKADVVVYDRLVDPSVLLLCRPDAERIYVGKQPGGGSTKQEEINRMLVRHGKAGKLVVRLKGGDPLVFGRGGEEVRALRRAGCRFRIVPGISAAIAAGGFAGMPLTDRRLASTAVLVTGREDPEKAVSSIDFAALARIDTVVFYMGVGSLSQITEKLMAAGRSGDTPAAALEWVGTPKQRTVAATLATLAEKAREANVQPPALVVVGQVVSLRETLRWYEDLPLFGKTVLVTRSRGQARPLVEKLSEQGAHVIEAPAIVIQALDDFSAADAALKEIGRFDWVVLTSANGAEALVRRLGHLGLDGRALAGAKMAAVGPGTETVLRGSFLTADLMPQEYTTEALGRALVATGLQSKRVLLARSDIATSELPEMLTQAGAEVREVPVYRTVRPKRLPAAASEALEGGRVDWITFTSASTVENFLRLAGGADLSAVKLAAIGPVTAKALADRGLKAVVIARPHTVEALAEAIVSVESE